MVSQNQNQINTSIGLGIGLGLGYSTISPQNTTGYSQMGLSN
jgi:hypothetical protein